MNALELAESAALGSLLVRPEQLRDVMPWLLSQDFSDPWNQHLYRHMQERCIGRQSLAIDAVGLSLADRVGYQRADLPRFERILRVTPAHPLARTYGRIVLEASLRRELRLQGVILKACALSAALTQSGRPVDVGADMVDQALREGEGRWQLASGESSSPSTTHPELAPALRNLDRYLASDRFLAAHPPPSVAEAREDERATVAALIRHPEQLSSIREWLRPELLSHPLWRAVYAAVLALDARADGVDAVTVAWELRRASEIDAESLDLAELVRAVDDAMNVDPAFTGRRVAAAAMKRTAEGSARLLDSAADNFGLDVPELYATGFVATAAVRAAAAPLREGPRGSHLQVVPTTPEARQVRGQAAG